MTKLGVLISGSGSNLQSIIDNIESGYISATIAVVITNNTGAYGIERAKKHGIPVEFVNFKGFSTREEYDGELVALLEAYGVELVLLAGYMKVVTGILLNAFKNRVINIHPALLPSFPGLHVQQKAIDHGAKFSGCTVHFVDEGVDTGPIIAQAAVPIFDDDTSDTLAQRILREEHKIYPLAVKLYTENRLRIKGRRVIIEPPITNTESVIINPPGDIFK